MSQNVHTPGPWEAAKDKSGDWFVQVAVQPKSCHLAFDRYRITHGWIGGDGTDNPNPELGNPEANARLIAAAPELLDALIKADQLIRLLGSISNADDAQPGSVGYEIQAAIAKATGAQP